MGAALREAWEELAVESADLEVLGRLSRLYIPHSGFCIHPFVAYSSRHPAFVPEAAEVAEVIEEPLAHLLDLATRVEEMWNLRGEMVRVPFYALGKHKVWGATAMVLSEFTVLLRAETRDHRRCVGMACTKKRHERSEPGDGSPRDGLVGALRSSFCACALGKGLYLCYDVYEIHALGGVSCTRNTRISFRKDRARTPAASGAGGQLQEALRHLRRGNVEIATHLAGQAMQAAQSRGDASGAGAARCLLAEAHTRAASAMDSR